MYAAVSALFAALNLLRSQTPIRLRQNVKRQVYRMENETPIPNYQSMYSQPRFL